MVLEPVISKRAGGADYSSYPVGSVILSASGDVGPEWLRCDGSYINESTYPELTAFLGKNSPGVQEAFKAGEVIYNGTFSTSYLFNGYLWVYWFQESLLLGFPLSGDPVLEIPLTGSMQFSESPDVPVVLSICGGRVFLAQMVPDLSDIYIFTGVFSIGAAAIAMTRVNTDGVMDNELVQDDLAIIGGTIYSGPGTISKKDLKYSPEIVYIRDFNNGTTVENVFLTILHISTIRYFGSSSAASVLHKGVLFGFYMSGTTNITGKRVALEELSGNSITIADGVQTIYKFNHKAENELLMIYGEYFNSFLKGVYQSANTGTTGATVLDPLLVAPIATNTNYIYRAYIKKGAMYIRAGTLNPYTGIAAAEKKINGITLSPYASLFPDSLEYISSHNLYIIFVGTGILFTHTPLDMDSWGYLDTTDYFGTITQWGGAEFDVETNTLCLTGRDTYGDYVCGFLRLHEHFDYSNDGAWLPYIASSGVPAWIKALPTAEA